METVELLVYLTVSIIVGTTFLYFLGTQDITGLYQEVTRLLFPDDQQDFDEVTVDKFTEQAYQAWQDCQFGRESLQRTYYVTGDELTKQSMFQRYKKINLCGSINSANYNCGSGEEVSFPDGSVTLPSVVTIACNASGLHIS